jgi:transposase
MTNKDFRALSPQAQEEIRFKAVAAVKAGRTQGEVAALFGVSRMAVCTWTSRCRRSGTDALKSRKRGRKLGGLLQARQEHSVIKAIEDRCPDQLKLPFYLWTREAVGQLIVRKFGVQLSVWTVGRYLERWEFTPQKPIRRAFEQNPEEVRRWLRREYPQIRRLARQHRATIYWGDEIGMRSDHAAGRSFSPRGETPVIPGTGKRFRCNMLSVISNRGKLLFMIFKYRFTTPVFLKFLRRLLRQNRRKILLIIDAHPVHVSAATTRWLQKHASRIRGYFLPGTSPELNPDEYINQDVKANAVGRTRPIDQGCAEVRSGMLRV